MGYGTRQQRWILAHTELRGDLESDVKGRTFAGDPFSNEFI